VGSERGNNSIRSEGETSAGNGLSIRNVERIKRWVVDKYREKRKKNIIIKGIRIPREMINDRKRYVE